MVNLGYMLLAAATLVTQILIVILIILYFVQRNKKEELAIFAFFRNNRTYFVFASTFIAMLGSLFFSEIAKFTPCVLCWYQRICMYPQAFLSYLSIMRDETKVLKPYLLLLNVVGLAVSLYHNFILLFPQYAEFLPCTTTGGPSCIKGYHFYFGYITIPLMAFTVFAFNIVILTLYGKDETKGKRHLVN